MTLMDAIYVRLSQNREHDMDKPQRQLDACSEWLTAHNPQSTPETYVDDDVSAFKGRVRRPEYERLMGDVRAGRVTRVVALHMDRFLRSMRDLEDLIDLVEQTGVKVHTVQSGELDLNTSAGRVQARILASVAAGESERKAERQSLKAAQLRSQGKSTGGSRPFGWESSEGDLDPLAADLIKQATQDVIEGKSLQSICREWNDIGVTTSRGNQWDNKALKRVLVRWRNAGQVEYQGEPVGEAVWPAIVSVDDVRLVRSVLNDGQRRTSPGPTPQHLLSNIARCGACDGLMIARRGTTQVGGVQTKVGIYQCREAGCYTTIRREWLDKPVRDAVRRRLAFTDVSTLAATPEDRERLSRLRSERDDIRAQQQEVGERVGRREWPMAAADTALKAFAERLEAIDRELAVIGQRFALVGMLGDTANVDPDTLDPITGKRVGGHKVSFAKYSAVGRRFDALDLSQRRAIVRELLKVTVLPGRKVEDRIVIETRDL